MRIGILGSGNIGGTLGKQWAKAGNEVCFGARNPNKGDVQSLVQSLGSKASAKSIDEAIAFGEVILFAIPGSAMDGTIAAHGHALNGKIVIDATNKMGHTPIHSHPAFAKHAPKAQFYRAFNIYGWENFDNPVYNGGLTGDMFFAGPDGQGRKMVEQLITDVGLGPIYLGGPDKADQVDDLFKLWITLFMERRIGRHFAFKLLTD